MIKFYNAILKVRKWKRLAESFFDPRLHLIINGMLCPRILPDMYFSIQFYSAHSGKKKSFRAWPKGLGESIYFYGKNG